MTAWAADVVDRAVTALRPLADPVQAAPMAAYMRHRFIFLGVPTPGRRSALRTALAGVPAPTQAQLAEAARTLWDLPEREFQYAACDLLARHNAACSADFLTSTAADLIVTRSWWDCVDSLRSAVVGPLVRRHPHLTQVMHTWVDADDRWLIRSAIIHQLGRRASTDHALLFELCARRAGDPEFFVAKAIGWALRDYSSTDPAAVTTFVDAHPELSALSRREALKAIGRLRDVR